MPNKSTRGMSSSDIGKIVFAAVAIVAAIVFVVFFMKGQQGHEVGSANLPPGSSPKVKAMREKGGGGTSPGSLGPGSTNAGGGSN